jgi:hypothetical protein
MKKIFTILCMLAAPVASELWKRPGKSMPGQVARKAD